MVTRPVLISSGAKELSTSDHQTTEWDFRCETKVAHSKTHLASFHYLSEIGLFENL